MRTLAIATVAALATMLSFNAAAQAQAEVVEEQQMTLPTGAVFVQAFLEANLSEDAVFKPFSIAPDIWYGVSDVLTIGLVHSGRGATGFLGGVGNGLCLAGESGGCGKVWDGFGLDARYHLHRGGSMTVAAGGGLFMGPLDPFTVSLKAGAIIRFQFGSVSLDLSPNIFFGLTERETEDPNMIVIASNKEILAMPATVMFAVSPKIALALQAGIVTPLEDAGDAFAISTSVGAQFMATEKILVDAAFSLPLVAGAENVGQGFDFRTFTVGFGYAL